MNEEIREFIVAMRTIVAFIAKLTPTQYDDLLVQWLSYLIGESPMPQELHPEMIPLHAESNYATIPWDALPWDKILPLIMPLILSALQRWLDSLKTEN